MSSNLPMAQRSGDLILSPIFLLCLQFFILIKSVYVSSFSLPFSSTPSSYSSSLQLSLFSSPFPLRLFILLVFSLFHPLIFNTACVQIENFFFKFTTETVYLLYQKYNVGTTPEREAGVRLVATDYPNRS